MKSVRPLLAAAFGLLVLGQECMAQQTAYPMLPQAAYGPMNGAAYAGAAMPTAYTQPSAPAPAAAASVAGDASACSDCLDPCDQTCRIRGWQVYAEYLMLRASNAEVAYAVPANGTPTANSVPVEVGPVGVLNPEFSSGYRFGFSRALDCAASLGASYTRFESQTSSTSSQDPGAYLHPLVIHPTTMNAASSCQVGSGAYDINFHLADLTYRCTFATGDRWAADFILGARYGHLEQEMRTRFDFNGTTNVDTGVDFDGGGPMLGLSFERHAACTGFLVYGRGMASFLAGQFDAAYLQQDTFAGTQVATSWEANRVVPVTEVEVGAGWANASGRVRFTAGYTINAWFNTVTTADWVQAVQRANFNHLSDTTVFDGVTARAEIRF